MIFMTIAWRALLPMNGTHVCTVYLGWKFTCYEHTMYMYNIVYATAKHA
jgi:hypothetical protein